jgi:tRNA 2-thiouridine synthesizing protein A
VSAVAEVLDLRGEVCPYTFVKTKLKLEEMESTEDLTVLLDDSTATANVSKSLRSEGHEILGLRSISEGVWEIRIKKA